MRKSSPTRGCCAMERKMNCYPCFREVDSYRSLFSAHLHTVSRSKPIAPQWHEATRIELLNARGCQFVPYRHINHFYTNLRGRDIITNRYTSKGFRYSYMSIRLLDYRYCSLLDLLIINWWKRISLRDLYSERHILLEWNILCELD